MSDAPKPVRRRDKLFLSCFILIGIIASLGGIFALVGSRQVAQDYGGAFNNTSVP